GYLGQRDWIATPGHHAEENEFFHARNFPRLLMPLLERLEVDRAHYVMVVTFGAIRDVVDAFEHEYSPWHNRLMGGQAAARIPEGETLFADVFRRINKLTSEKVRS
ncbi:MAG: hypothetical protein IH987_17720, partial [Planctomycetes bacterium]|nr:hypothetical protein [Planctomycetota bacterium]